MVNIKIVIKSFKYIISILFILIFLLFIINLIVTHEASKYILDKNSSIPKVDAVIIPGAFVYSSGKVSDILKDRLDTALELMKNNKDLKIIVTGDHGDPNYDEVNAMRNYLEQRGIPTANIFMDHAGFSTYESIYRAKEIFDVNKAVIVTQDYHLKRAVYIARKKGIEAYGVTADKHVYVEIKKYQVRESFAICKDFFLVNVLRIEPKFLGDKIPVMNSDGRITHDKKNE